jgi:hypothetical protein
MSSFEIGERVCVVTVMSAVTDRASSVLRSKKVWQFELVLDQQEDFRTHIEFGEKSQRMNHARA